MNSSEKTKNKIETNFLFSVSSEKKFVLFLVQKKVILFLFERHFLSHTLKAKREIYINEKRIIIRENFEIRK